jgi:L-threonylcarbamoyladenylate synthase
VIRIRVDPSRPDTAALEPAARALRGGGLVAFPTETVYGLGAHALDPAAVARIFEAKGRPAYNPLIVHVADVEAARALAATWPEAAERLAERFWPGPLTLVVPRGARVPDAVSAGLPSVGLRIPAHPVAHALLSLAAVPVAAPSANRSGRVSPTTAEHVARGLGERVTVLVDGGACPVGIESTVIDLSGPHPALLRPGSVSLGELRKVIPELGAPDAAAEGAAPRRSPGMLERHYAPRARLRVMDPGERERLLSAAGEGAVGALLLHPAPAGGPRVAVRMPGDPRGYASRLYAALHAVDDAGCEVVLVDAVPAGPEWAAVRDRLRRAGDPGETGDIPTANEALARKAPEP